MANQEWAPPAVNQRGAFTNLDSGETMVFQFNPGNFSEQISANYAKHQVPGLSHEVLQYINTSNNVITLSLYMSSVYAWMQNSGLTKTFDEIVIDPTTRQRVGTTPFASSSSDLDSAYNLTDMKKYLQSLLYPWKLPNGSRSAPPIILFVWPKVVRMLCVAKDISFDHQRFSTQDLRTIAMTVDITLEEVSQNIKYAQDVRKSGSMNENRYSRRTY